jgi:hypothetical protein
MLPLFSRLGYSIPKIDLASRVCKSVRQQRHEEPQRLGVRRNSYALGEAGHALRGIRIYACLSAV